MLCSDECSQDAKGEILGCGEKISMNSWTQLSIEYANQRSYMDDLFHVYPTIPEGIRDIDSKLWRNIEKAFEQRNNVELLKNLLKLGLFPIKDSYVAYLKRDKSSLERNPATVNHLCGRLYEMGLDALFLAALNLKKRTGKSAHYSGGG